MTSSVQLTLLLLSLTSAALSSAVTWTYAQPDTYPAFQDTLIRGSNPGQIERRELPEYFANTESYPKQYHRPTTQNQPTGAHDQSYAGTHTQGTSSTHLGQPLAYHYVIYQHHPPGKSQQEPISSYKTKKDDSSGSKGWLCRMLGGICDVGKDREDFDEDSETAILKGLGVVGVVAIIALPFIAAILIVWFLPVVPAVVVTARSLVTRGARSFHETLLRDKCLERLTCEISKFATAYEFEAPWVTEIFNKSPQPIWIERIAKAAQSTGTTRCDAYTCNQVTSLKKML